MILKGKIEIFKHKIVPVPLCPSQIPYGLACGKRLTNNGLRYGNNAKYSITTFIYTSIVKIIKECYSYQIREMKRVSSVRSKFHSRTRHEVPEGEKSYRSTLPLTSMLDRGG